MLNKTSDEKEPQEGSDVHKYQFFIMMRKLGPRKTKELM